MTFGEKINLLKRHNGLSDRRLAEELDMSPKAIGNLIRRGATPRPWTARRLADFFGVGVSDLLDDTFEIDLAELENRREKEANESSRSIKASAHSADSVRAPGKIKQVVFELDLERRIQLRQTIGKLNALKKDLVGQIEILKKDLESLALKPKTWGRSKG